MTALHVDAEARRGGFDLQVHLDVPPGSVVGVVGPNGAGKTTLLRAIAGLTPLESGSLRLGETVLEDTSGGICMPVDRRPVGYVFQDYRLFPHLTVVDNVAFALRCRGMGRAASRATVRPLLERLDLDRLATRRPGQLSGGQGQRVALARALAGDPQVLLLDEPLAALDARTRVEVRAGLRQHLAEFPGVCLLVTHDPLEALLLADRLVVLEDGRVTQEGAPGEVARRPETAYVASLVGLNFYRGAATPDGTVTIAGGATLVAAHSDVAGDVLVTFRPSSVAVYLDPPQHGSPRNSWSGTIGGVELLPDRVRVQVDGAVPAYADVTPAAVADLGLAPGVRVWLSVKSTEIDVYPGAAT